MNRHKDYNKDKRDYYFLVIPKRFTRNTKVLINGCKGLNSLTSNNHNLPFQIKWDDNKKYKYQPIREIVNKFIQTIQRPQPTWQEVFLANIRTLQTN